MIWLFSAHQLIFQVDCE